MARLPIPDGEKDESYRLYELSPRLGPAALALRQTVYSSHGLSERLFESCRMRIALINGCPICLRFRSPEGQKAGLTEEFYNEVRNYKTSNEFDTREKLAIEYAEKFALDHFSITQDFFDKLRANFSDEEIMTLTICIARHMAFGRITTVMELAADCSIAPQPQHAATPVPQGALAS